jgi:hypothetical protein
MARPVLTSPSLVSVSFLVDPRGQIGIIQKSFAEPPRRTYGENLPRGTAIILQWTGSVRARSRQPPFGGPAMPHRAVGGGPGVRDLIRLRNLAAKYRGLPVCLAVDLALAGPGAIPFPNVRSGAQGVDVPVASGELDIDGGDQRRPGRSQPGRPLQNDLRGRGRHLVDPRRRDHPPGVGSVGLRPYLQTEKVLAHWCLTPTWLAPGKRIGSPETNRENQHHGLVVPLPES